jgi:hypothetical protein
VSVPENWKEIPKFPQYSASTWGRVRGKRGILIGTLRHGHVEIILDRTRRRKSNLILGTFDRPRRVPEIAGFRDGNPRNCALENLFWTFPKVAEWSVEPDVAEKTWRLRLNGVSPMKIAKTLDMPHGKVKHVLTNMALILER